VLKEKRMSLHPQALCPIPEETARVARAAYPKGNVYLSIRDELGTVYQDESFAHLFAHCGQPAEAPWRLLLVCLMQFAEGLSDQQAAEAVRGRLDWKYLLSLDLTDPGFDASVLCEFRQRLLEGKADQLILQPLLDLALARGWLKARGKQRTDSTHVFGAIRTLHRLETVGETMRATLNVLATVAPDWLRPQVSEAWVDRYEKRFEGYRLPKGKAERKAYAEVIGTDGFQLLSAIYNETAPTWLREVPMVQVLRQVWVQQYYAPQGPAIWRTEDDLPPSALQIHSPYDAEARFSTKREILWAGYKVHLTETCDEEQPHLITHVETTPATTYDGAVTETIHAALEAKALLPEEHVVDSGYLDAEVLVSAEQRQKVSLIGPVAQDTSWQARDEQGFDKSRFSIDWQTQQVTCPQGKISRYWISTYDRHGKDVIHIKFNPADCKICPSRVLCTQAKAGARMLGIHPDQEQHQALQKARLRQKAPDFKQKYAKRAGIEGTISQGVRGFDLRHSRYIGLTKTRLQHLFVAASLNLVRMGAWLLGKPQAQTRRSQFKKLMSSEPDQIPA
jgi:transposase